MKLLVLLNTRAGTASQDLADQVRKEFVAMQAQAEVCETTGEELERLARGAAARDFDAVVAAGGDGTVSTIAAALAGTATPLGILPLGTWNHFARDLGLPLDLTAAVRTIALGRPLEVDVARVNGRVFVNNASIGLYAHVVRRREVRRERLRSNKWLATFFAVLRVFRRFPSMRVRLEVQGGTALRTSPFVFVGNNQYEMHLLAIGRRPRLDAGQLTLYVANRSGRLGILRLALRGLLGRLEQARDFDYLHVQEVRVESGKSRLLMAIDGELVRMAPPLHFEIWPQALTVLTPNT
ncbi:MAG: sphingosine kinase [Planctomycetaceae bacterium]|nr:MAG: sphingosine kinase [Planctomycetaceae bacterium]